MAKKVNNKQGLIRLIEAVPEKKLKVLVDKSPYEYTQENDQPMEYIEGSYEVEFTLRNEGQNQNLATEKPMLEIGFWKTYGGDLIIKDEEYEEVVAPVIARLENENEEEALEILDSLTDITLEEVDEDEIEEETQEEPTPDVEPEPEIEEDENDGKGETNPPDVKNVMEGDKITWTDSVLKVENDIIYTKSGAEIDTKDEYQVDAIQRIIDGEKKKETRRKQEIIDSFLDHLKSLPEEEQAVIREETGIEF